MVGQEMLAIQGKYPRNYVQNRVSNKQANKLAGEAFDGHVVALLWLCAFVSFGEENWNRAT